MWWLLAVGFLSAGLGTVMFFGAIIEGLGSSTDVGGRLMKKAIPLMGIGWVLLLIFAVRYFGN